MKTTKKFKSAADDLRLPPQDLDAEASILGAILLDGQAMATAQTLITPEDFYRSANRTIFEAMLALDATGEAIDNITLPDQLELQGKLEAVGGRAALAELIAIVPSSSNIGHHCRIVHEKAMRRSLACTSDGLLAKAYDASVSTEDLLAEAEREIFRLSVGSDQSGFRPIGDIASEALDQLDAAELRGDGITGVATGFMEIDELTGGLQPASLTVIAARPGMGKSSLALGMALHAVLAHRLSVGFISLEMTEKEINARIMSAMTGIDVQALLRGKLTPTGRQRVGQAAQQLGQVRLHVNDHPWLTLQKLRGEARRLKLKLGLDLLVLDYLQLLSVPEGTDSSRQEHIADASRGLKLLAKELGIPIVVLSQLNRQCEARNDKRPMLSDLRESGAIEQDADTVMLIYRDEVYDFESPLKGRAEILVRKNRNGPICDLELSFHSPTASFQNMSTSSLTSSKPVDETEVNLDD